MIQLPEKFAQDIQGKDTYLVPLIIIDNRLFLSTSKLTLGNQYYEPLLSSLGGIKESVDLQNKSFKISSISLEFYNYEYNNEFLSNRLFAPSVMNKRITIYYKSQSAESLDDSLQVYTGYIKNITENKDKLTLEAEDKTEQALHKELPIEYVRDDIDLPDKYKNAKVPLVYGSVEKAPCVYYDLYSTTVEDGSKDYSLTPDSFAIKEIKKLHIFNDDTYLGIKQFSSLFQGIADGTKYRNVTSQQYNILGNRIFIEKTIDTGAANQEDISGIRASTIAFNFVEVEHIGKVTYSGGTYNLYYQYQGEQFQKREAPIKMFKDLEGTVPSSDLDDQPYFDVKDFSNIPDDIAIPEYWMWGSNNFNTSVYTNIYGENIINFESEKICKESDIVTELDGKDAWGWVNLEFNLEAGVDEIFTTGSLLPNLMFRWTDRTANIWNISPNDANLDIYSKEGGTSAMFQPTFNITNNMFSIGQRQLRQGDLSLVNQNGSMKYLKINKLQLIRTMILNNFINYEKYMEGLPLNKCKQIHLCKMGYESKLAKDLHKCPDINEFEEIKTLVNKWNSIEYITIEYYKDITKLISSINNLKYKLDD